MVNEIFDKQLWSQSCQIGYVSAQSKTQSKSNIYNIDYHHILYYKYSMVSQEHSYSRTLDLSSLMQQKSHFLLGPRSVGKTTLIHMQLPKARNYNLLDPETFTRLLRRPQILDEETTSKDKIVVIDEIQKMPQLLDVVQKIIQEKKIKFLLTGSSARKLKRHQSNLLGGRAWQANLFPLTFAEIPNFDLVRYLNRGGIPHIYQSSFFEKELTHYLNLYIKEEIIAEAQLRKVDQFVRFMDVLGIQNGEELNYQGISNDTGIKAVTIQTYIELLKDTLIGYELPAFVQTKKRKAITRSKLFLFDVGVVNKLANRGEIKPDSELFGKAFEHFIINELRAYLHYSEINQKLSYWRSTSGFEVDAIIGNEWAIEIKSTKNAADHDLKGLKALREEGLVKHYSLVCMDQRSRVIDGIEVIHYEKFLQRLRKKS